MPTPSMLAASGGFVLGGCFLFLRAQKPRSIEATPTQMKQAFLIQGSPDITAAKIEVRQVEVPKPRSGQVLVKVAAAPINPSDDGVWKQDKVKGATPIGIECSGTVVATGGGLAANRLLGKKVAVVAGQGTYSEYIVCDAFKQAYTLPPSLPVEMGCAFFVNPFTAVGIVESVREAGGKAFVHTAGASQLGQMLAKLCKLEGMTLVSVVRRGEQKEMLVKLGCDEKHVVVTGEGDAWKEVLRGLVKDLKIKFAFDAIAGVMSGDVLTLLPSGGCVWVYGRLSDQAISGVQPLDLIYRGKKLQGFMVKNWMMKDGPLRGLRRSIKVANIVCKYLDSVFASDFVDVSLEDMHERYCELKKQGVSGAKMRVRPH